MPTPPAASPALVDELASMMVENLAENAENADAADDARIERNSRVKPLYKGVRPPPLTAGGTLASDAKPKS